MSELYFDTEIFRKDTSVYSSLEDLNGYRVFSDAFYEKMLQTKEEEQLKLMENYRVVFTNEVQDTLNETYMLVLNSTQPLVIRNDFEQELGRNGYSSIVYVAVGMLVTTAFLIILHMIKNIRKKDNENNNYNTGI